ncbi:alpha-N-arabinofuranosidase [Duganella sp. FT92W]|uniref:non-reducing end alpha-L-arabinofuranosidase n=2 Tax=Pseudoduganella rivuli TaxID=2666085 RepID=A0A7X2LQN2_9BURK|nr:alpha-N-arabinofuranosidase [Pseudoduganella rivuli]
MIGRLLAMSALCAASHALAATQAATAQLHADQPGPTIPRYIYGQFSEHLGSGIYDGIWVGEKSSIPNVRGIRSDVVRALRELKVPLIRWPGGCFADDYNWRDGIGPRDKRPGRKNNWWTGKHESNQFGTHEFMDFAEQVGADAYIGVNLGSAPPRDMRDWMEYMTSDGDNALANERRRNGRDQPFKVPVVGIGNESWGCGGNMRPEYYADEYRRFQTFFHNNGQAAPAAIRVASGADREDYNWTDVVMKQAGAKLDALSLHYYTLPPADWKEGGKATRFSKEEWVAILAGALRIDDIIRRHAAIMDKYDPKKRVGLYVDEWGTWYRSDSGKFDWDLRQQNTLRDGVVAAAHFNIFHRHTDRVKQTSIAQTMNVLQAMILTDGPKMVLTPTYYAFKMYVPFQDATALPLDVSSPSYRLGATAIPSINASAAKGKDGKIYIGIANMNPDDNVQFSVNLGTLAATKVSGQVLTAQQMDQFNEFGKSPAVAAQPYRGATLANGALTLDLPAKSVVVVGLE